jgi:hypothetical protein
VEEVDLPGRRVRLSGEPEPGVGRRPELHPYLRRWDQRDAPRRPRKGGGAAAARLRRGAVPIEEGHWVPLEDGVEVYFAPGGTYRSGDHWLVPARTATGAVEWPVNAARKPLLRAPDGIQVHYAPLGWVFGEGEVSDLRMTFAPLAAPVPAAEATARTEAAEPEADGGSTEVPGR